MHAPESATTQDEPAARTAERRQPAPARRATASWFWVLLAVVTLVGLGIRVGYIATERWDYPPDGDAMWYHASANSVADGDGIVNPFLSASGIVAPSADHPPLYTLYLAGFSLVGIDTPNGHVLASALLGAASVFVAGLAGRRIGGDRLGVLAAAMVAVYPNLWRHDGMLMSETVAIFTVALAVWLAYRYLDRPDVIGLALVGGTVGLATLARSELILLALFLVVPLVFTGGGDRPWAERLRWLGVAAAACIVVVAPWVIRNWVQLDRPMLSNQFEVTLLAANCESTYYGDLIGYWDFHCGVPVLAEEDLDDPTDPRYVEVQGEAAREFIFDNLDRTPAVMAARLGRNLNLYRPSQQVNLEVHGEANTRWVANVGVWTFRLFFVAGIAGAIVLRRRRVPLFPVVAPIATVVVTVVLLYSTVRFRAPADLSLALLAAVALDGLWNVVAERSGSAPAQARQPAGQR
jgi:4-amino-4-deoxy-L-arabinose transferase-like glycosyltransferase